MFDNEEQMKQSMQQAYLPKNIPTFQDTLKRAKVKRAAQSTLLIRVAVAAAVLVGVVSLALSYQGTSNQAVVTPVPLQAIKIEPSPTPNPTSAPRQTPPVEEAPQPAGENPPKKKEKAAEEIGHLVVNTYPLIGLSVVIDQKITNYKTPVTGDGIPLAPGEYWLYFKEASGSMHGPYQITITKDVTTRQMFDLSVKLTMEQQKKKIRDKLKGFEQEEPAPSTIPLSIEEEKQKIREGLIGFDGEPVDTGTIKNPFKGETKSDYGYVQIETKPKKSLLVYIDGKDSGFTTPVRDTGVRLPPGTYQIELKDSSYVSYGKFSVIVNAGSTQKQTFSVSKQSPNTSSPRIKDGQLTNPFDPK